MVINTFYNAVKYLATELPNAVTPSDDRRKMVSKFQKELTKTLNNMSYDSSWFEEVITQGAKYKDRIDVFGASGKNSKRIKPYKNSYNLCERISDNDWIVEIDAQRSDQVAKKFLSRLALTCLTNKDITYVAVLYNRKNNNRIECLKFGDFAFHILKSLNKKNNFYMILVDSQSSTPKVEVFDFSKRPGYTISFKGEILKKGLNMVEAAKEAVKIFLSIYNMTYPDLKKVFNHFIADEVGKSRYRKIGMKCIDKKEIFIYSQWRNNFGERDNWVDFVNLCSNYGIKIKFDPDSLLLYS